MKYFLDLFSGIGGFALGAEWGGMKFDGHYFSEVDGYAISVYQKRFPDAIGLGDIRAVRGTDLPSGEWIIAGGFPCQDISVAGKGAGLEGERSGLWFEYARIIGELRPRFAIMENVGALTIRGLDRVLGSLAALGYDAEWQDIRASDVGAPHRRERIWIVAYPDGKRREAGRHTERGNENIFSEKRTPEKNIKQRDNGINRTCSVGETLADSDETRREGQCKSGGSCEEYTLAGCGGAFMADSSDGGNVRRDGELEPAEGEVREHRRSASHGRREWLAAEPDVGGTIDGLSAWLDGFDGINTHKYNMTYGTTEKERPGKILRALRSEIRANQDQWEARGSECIPPQEILLAYLCKLETRLDKQTDLFMESPETPQGSLRSLRDEEESSGSPHRSESEKQHTRERRDALQTLPRLLALDAEKAWLAYRRENALSLLSHWLPGWEDGIPRVSSKVPSRVDRLKCLGNSIVPQIAELIFAQSAFDRWRLQNDRPPKK